MSGAERPRLIALTGGDAPPSESLTAGMAHVLVVSGFPWYVSEAAVYRYLCGLLPRAAPITTRLYANPVNGVSRGHCFVEYASASVGSGSRMEDPTRNTALSMNSAANGGGSGVGGRGGASAAHHGGRSGPSNTPNSNDGSGGAPVVDLVEVQHAVEATPFERVYLSATVYALTSTRWDRAGNLPELPTDPPAPPRGQIGYGEEGFAVRCGPSLGLPNTVTAHGAARLRSLRKRWRSANRRSGSAS